MNLEILTPDAAVYAGEVTAVTVPGSLGMFQVLHNHAPIISTLSKGQIKIATVNEGEKIYAAEGGVIEVLKNKIIILAEKIDAEESN